MGSHRVGHNWSDLAAAAAAAAATEPMAVSYSILSACSRPAIIAGVLPIFPHFTFNRILWVRNCLILFLKIRLRVNKNQRVTSPRSKRTWIWIHTLSSTTAHPLNHQATQLSPLLLLAGLNARGRLGTETMNTGPNSRALKMDLCCSLAQAQETTIKQKKDIWGSLLSSSIFHVAGHKYHLYAFTMGLPWWLRW